jgi:hypothetical protein
MKKQLLTILATGAISSMFAQLPVSTTPTNRKVVIEEFTGIKCQYCPDGHKIANTIKASKAPGEVILVNIHTGSYANPVGNEPDYRTTEGTAIAGMPGMGITGYPTGAINRHIFSGTAMAHSRGAWTTNANTILAQSSPVNVAIQGTLNAVTRVLQVQAEVYYTGNSITPTNSLTIALLENWVVGPQTSGAVYYPAMTNPDGSYNHQHMLRKVLTTGSFGIPVAPTTAGSSYTSSIITYTVPATFGAGTFTNACSLGNLELIAFVADNQTEIRTAAYGPIQITGIANARDLAPSNLVTDAQVCAGKLNSTFKFTNSGSVTATSAVFAYSINGGAPTNYTWTGTVNALAQSPIITLPVINFSPIASNTLDISVVSVNGLSDQNITNDNVSKVNIPLTTTNANSTMMQMDFTQDRYGTESNWKLYDEVTGVLLQQDGPWSPDLAANGTALHTRTWTAVPNTCYKLVVTDSYGDGINAGYGVGGYILKSATLPIYTSNGQYGAGENKWHKTSIAAGIYAPAMSLSGVNLYPNPAYNSTNLSIELTQNESVNILVLNAIGQEVYTSKSNNYDAGVNTITLNTEEWAAGVYNINISTAKGSVNQKLTITK